MRTSERAKRGMTMRRHLLFTNEEFILVAYRSHILVVSPRCIASPMPSRFLWRVQWPSISHHTPHVTRQTSLSYHRSMLGVTQYPLPPPTPPIQNLQQTIPIVLTKLPPSRNDSLQPGSSRSLESLVSIFARVDRTGEDHGGLVVIWMGVLLSWFD